MSSMQGGVLRVLGWAGRVCVSVRGAHVHSRRPVRVHLKGQVKEVEDQLRHYEDKVKRSTIHPRKEQQKSEHHQHKPQATSIDTEALLRSSIRYKLLSEAGNYEKKLLENVKSQKYRRQHQLFVAEGHRIIREALKHGATPEALYFTRLKLVAALKDTSTKLQLEDLYSLSDLPLFKAPYKTLQTWSSVTTSPGIVGVFKIPTTTEAPNKPSTTTTTTLPLTVVLDELREPGNLGVVLRTAAAVGVHQVLLMKGCCDPWDVKVVRAGCGAHFRLKLSSKLTWDGFSNHMAEDARIFLADVSRGEDILEGVEEGVDTASTKEGEEGDVKSEESLEDNVYEIDEDGKRMLVDHSYSDPQHLELYQHVSLPTLSYDQMGQAWGEGGAVLVIGGELGVSNAAKKFVADNLGSKVTVPLANGMDSLSVGVASGVILYEMQKQLHESATNRLWKERHESAG